MEENRKAELIKGMFSNCSFTDSVVAGIAESGSEVFYEKTSEQKKNTGESISGKEAIMEYVDRLKPMVRQEYQERYEEIWLGILDLKEVRQEVYNKGKQQDTTFNRNLVAQIFHMMIDKIFPPDTRVVHMAERLEPEKGAEHPVRKKLGETPDKNIKKSVENYLLENL